MIQKYNGQLNNFLVWIYSSTLWNCRKLTAQSKFFENPKNQGFCIYILSGNLSTIPIMIERMAGYLCNYYSINKDLWKK